jgi:glycosyltransferase involved in cell wall biosynthesis
MRNALKLARRCFFVAEANRILAEKQLGCDFDNAEVVRNPLVIQIDGPFSWPSVAVEEQLRMACVARLSAEKGQDILLEALTTERWRQRNWRLNLYGNGPTQSVLERLVARFQLGHRVHFAGHAAVEHVWREDHLLVMASRCEGMPLAIVEAMACGRPVVATNVGGISELVQEGVTGFLAVAPVAECVNVALERMWSHRARLKEFGHRAAASAREFIPDDPVKIFAEKLLAVADLPG